MNQKYLQGLASDMAGASSAVFFEATPENIAAFLMQHQAADLSAIGTADGRTFLTARTGLIDVCPDQEYLIQKLLPIYSKVQMGIAPVPPLKTVSKSVAASEECPRPDWNYLRWEGCSDQKYQDILSGKFLLGLPGQEETVSMEVQVRSYFNACKLALELVDWSSGEPESWGHLTVNLGSPVRAVPWGVGSLPEGQPPAKPCGSMSGRRRPGPGGRGEAAGGVRGPGTEGVYPDAAQGEGLE